MKKIFTLVAAALLGMGGANAAITVKHGDTVLKDGDVVALTMANFSALAENMGYVDTHISFETNADPVNLNFKGDSSYLSFCEDSGSCHSLFEDATNKGTYILNLKEESKQFGIHVQGPMGVQTDYPEVKGEVEVTATDALGQKIAFKVTIDTTQGAAVKGVGADKALISVSGGKALVNGSATGVEVYNLLGQRVANEGLHGMYLVKAGKAVKKVLVK